MYPWLSRQCIHNYLDIVQIMLKRPLLGLLAAALLTVHQAAVLLVFFIQTQDVPTWGRPCDRHVILRHKNQSTNQSIYLSINQSINQSIYQAINQIIDSWSIKIDVLSRIDLQKSIKIIFILSFNRIYKYWSLNHYYTLLFNRKYKYWSLNHFYTLLFNRIYKYRSLNHFNTLLFNRIYKYGSLNHFYTLLFNRIYKYRSLNHFYALFFNWPLTFNPTLSCFHFWLAAPVQGSSGTFPPADTVVRHASSRRSSSLMLRENTCQKQSKVCWQHNYLLGLKTLQEDIYVTKNITSRREIWWRILILQSWISGNNGTLTYIL